MHEDVIKRLKYWEIFHEWDVSHCITLGDIIMRDCLKPCYIVISFHCGIFCKFSKTVTEPGDCMFFWVSGSPKHHRCS